MPFGERKDRIETSQSAGLCLLAVMFLDFKVRVEVEDNLLVGFRGVDNPLAVLVGGVVLGVTWGSDVSSIFGIQPTSAGWIWKREHHQRTSDTAFLPQLLPPRGCLQLV